MKSSRSSNKISFPTFFCFEGILSTTVIRFDGKISHNYFTEQHFFSSAFLKAILEVINNLNILWAIVKTLPTTYMGLASLAVHADY
jgi:hypothetical protein